MPTPYQNMQDPIERLSNIEQKLKDLKQDIKRLEQFEHLLSNIIATFELERNKVIAITDPARYGKGIASLSEDWIRRYKEINHSNQHKEESNADKSSHSEENKNS